MRTNKKISQLNNFMTEKARAAVTKIQKNLKKLKMYSGEIDGDPGPLTAAALEQFFTKDKSKLPWMNWAIGEFGVSEIYGERDNPRIVYYHSNTGLGAKDDEVAWCSSFVNTALIDGAGIMGTKSAAAASFKKFGTEVDPKTYGAILLIETQTGSRRHVFFNSGWQDEYIFGLGGNQSDRVNIIVPHISKIKEARFPKF